MQEKAGMTTLVGVLQNVKEEGYTADFRVTDNDRLAVLGSTETFAPEQVQIVNFYRFEGESYPGDMAILYVVETSTGLKGTISDAYGTYYDEKTESFMRQVEDLGKNLDKHTGK